MLTTTIETPRLITRISLMKTCLGHNLNNKATI